VRDRIRKQGRASLTNSELPAACLKDANNSLQR
jgi:hypothetical protein